MDILILCVAIIANTCVSVFNACYGRARKSNAFLFTAVASLTVCLFFLCYNGFRLVFDTYTFLMACLFAIAYLTCMVSNVNAVKRGSVGITSLMVSFSLLLPTLFGIIFWKEKASLLFYIGLICLGVAIVLTNLKKENEAERLARAEKGKFNFVWLLFVFLAFTGNGSCSIIQTYHQKTGGTPYKAEFMIMAMCIVCVINAVAALCMLKRETKEYIKSATVWGALYGVCNAIVNLGVMLLVSNGVIKQSVFFPMISIGTIILVFAASLILFKEKFRPVQYIGVIVGIAAIVFLQL